MHIDCIIAFSFGAGRNGFINHANRSLRMNILASDFVLNMKPPPPLIAQGELAGEFLFLNSQMTPAHIIIEPHPYRAARAAYAAMRLRHWKTCVIAAHEDRIELHIKLMQKLGLKVEGTITAKTYDPRAKEFFFRNRCVHRAYRWFETRYYAHKGWI